VKWSQRRTQQTHAHTPLPSPPLHCRFFAETHPWRAGTRPRESANLAGQWTRTRTHTNKALCCPRLLSLYSPLLHTSLSLHLLALPTLLPVPCAKFVLHPKRTSPGLEVAPPDSQQNTSDHFSLFSNSPPSSATRLAESAIA